MRPLGKIISEADYIVVGSGFYGLTLAERIASELNKKVVVIEKRNHMGGNAYSYIDNETGVEVHKYGSHLFHTSNEAIWNYVNRFSKFNSYRHFVIAKSGGQEYEMPINLSTISGIFGESLNPLNAKRRVEEEISKLSISDVQNLEDFALSQVGRQVYEKLIKGYTTKQWGKPPSELPREIFQRLPIRYNYNRDYFSDSYMGLPIDGYFKIFDRMVQSENIRVLLETDYFEIREMIPSSKKLIYSGPLDQFFDYKYGSLEWRTLDFEFENLGVSDFQGCAVVNYPDIEVPYTRIHEFKHLHPEREQSNSTTISREFSRLASRNDEPYYPINTPNNSEIYLKYKAEAKLQTNLIIGGRLGSYKYLDMHMAIGMALRDFDVLKEDQLI
jgi:UDP-galactopyranose mutase